MRYVSSAKASLDLACFAGSWSLLVGVRPEDASCDFAKMVFTDPS